MGSKIPSNFGFEGRLTKHPRLDEGQIDSKNEALPAEEKEVSLFRFLPQQDGLFSSSGSLAQPSLNQPSFSFNPFGGANADNAASAKLIDLFQKKQPASASTISDEDYDSDGSGELGSASLRSSISEDGIPEYSMAPLDLYNKALELAKDLEESPTQLNKENWIKALKEFLPMIENLETSNFSAKPYSSIKSFAFNQVEGIAGSFVEFEPGQQNYILLQMPTEETIRAVLKSALEHKAPAIVCLASVNDKISPRKSCYDYTKDYKDDDLESIKVNEQEAYDLLMYLSDYDPNTETGTLTRHFSIEGWFDKKTEPEAEALFWVIERFHNVVKDSKGIPFVHCSAAVNRSRFFVIMHLIYTELLKNPDAKINVAKLLLLSCLHRGHMRHYEKDEQHEEEWPVLDMLEKFIPQMAQWLAAKSQK